MEEPYLQESKEEGTALKPKCELCGQVDFAYKFKRSKRFCSMACAKSQLLISHQQQGQWDLELPNMHMRDLVGMGHHFLPSEPTKWNVKDVYEFFSSLPGRQDIAKEFHAQEINGQALLLLMENHLMSAMNIKLGPALKISTCISMLEGSYGWWGSEIWPRASS
ncbi:Polyhomeotic-like protein 2 [Fukomys damarensis]|uniref:Polyhomeotic-like protein 2 n=1 Tax=Fukomys damarensis TaxID=885580 RepID=A0A091DLL3_FUKDA|nr:Polyhomeotic-like protein 2 [Fukomys damarensis]